MRIKKLQNSLNDIDLALVFSLNKEPNSNMIYFTGYRGLGVLAVLKNKSFLLVPDMEYEKAKKTKLRVYRTDKKKKLLETLTSLITKTKVKKIGIEEDKCTVYLYKKLRKGIKGKYVDLSETCSKIRMMKEPQEIKLIKKACSVTDNIFSKISNNFNFKTEKELRNYIIKEIEKSDCELAFPPIVASGHSSSQPHYDELGKINNGFLMLDFGAKYKGYCSDMTRMLYIGKPSEQELIDYALVLATIERCELLVSKKKKFSQLYETAITALGEKSEYFTHALGHGLGLDIHEQPALFTEDTNQIQDKMVFTIEPGIYFPERYGIRIEDTVLFNKGKLEILTKSKKDLVII